MNNKDQFEGFGWVVKCAAVYFLLVGFAWTFMPERVFGWFDGVLPGPAIVWQWMGLVTLTYGFGLFLASYHPARNWIVLLIGAIAMALTVLLTLEPAVREQIPRGLGVLIIVSNIIWLIPFSMILLMLAGKPVDEFSRAPVPADLKLDQYKDQSGTSLASRSSNQPVLLVLLRHLGCTFCRESLAQIRDMRTQIEQNGTSIALVHMGEEERARALFERYQLGDVPRFSDPDGQLYKSLGLVKASVLETYGPNLWGRFLQSAVLDGNGFGQAVGDRFQMPGAFLIAQSAVVGGYRPQRISDQPDFISIARCAAPTEDLQQF